MFNYKKWIFIGIVALLMMGYVHFSGDTEYNYEFRHFLRFLKKAL